MAEAEKELFEHEGQTYEVQGYAADGLPILKGIATSVHHTDDDGNLLYDEEGNPVRSVHVSVAPTQAPVEEGAN